MTCEVGRRAGERGGSRGARFPPCVRLAAPLAAAYFFSCSRWARSGRLFPNVTHVKFDRAHLVAVAGCPVDCEQQVAAVNIERDCQGPRPQLRPAPGDPGAQRGRGRHQHLGCWTSSGCRSQSRYRALSGPATRLDRSAAIDHGSMEIGSTQSHYRVARATLSMPSAFSGLGGRRSRTVMGRAPRARSRDRCPR
jgi:hypothetical protein